MPYSVWIRRCARIGVLRRRTPEDDLVRAGAADRESVADHGPLRFAVEAEHLAEVVNQAGENHPARLVGSARSASAVCSACSICGEVGVGVAVVHERVQILERLPDADPLPVQGEKLPLFCQDEIERLISVIEPVELFDRRAPPPRSCETRQPAWRAPQAGLPATPAWSFSLAPGTLYGLDGSHRHEVDDCNTETKHVTRVNVFISVR